MDRRRFLGAAGGGLGLALVGSAVSGISTGSATKQQTDSGYEPLGRVEVPGAREAAVHHDGEVAYVATGDGFAAVDIADPEEPTVLAERRDVDTGDGPEFAVAWDLWPSGDRLVVAGPAQHAPGTAQGFALFDITDPADPEQVAWYGTEHYIHNGFFEDGTVYLTGSGLPEYPLVVVDVTDDEPEERARWSIVDHDSDWESVPLSNRVLHDVYVQDEIAYLPYWDAGTWIVDVSDPADPNVLSRVGELSRDELAELFGTEVRRQATVPPGNAHYAQVNEDASILLVGTEAWEAQDPDSTDGTIGGPGGVDLWDISDAESPALLAHIDPPESFDNTDGGWFTTAHNCDIVGNRLYCSWYYGGITVHDVSDPSEPERLAWWRDPREASFWTAQSATPGETFVGSSTDLSGTHAVPNETREALYVFPDEAGTQANAPDLTEPPSETPTPGSTSTTTPSPTPSETPSPTATPPETPSPTATPGNTPTPTRTGTPTPEEGAADADDGGPGFGVAGALAGLGGVMYALARLDGVDGDGK